MSVCWSPYIEPTCDMVSGMMFVLCKNVYSQRTCHFPGIPLRSCDMWKYNIVLTLFLWFLCWIHEFLQVGTVCGLFGSNLLNSVHQLRFRMIYEKKHFFVFFMFKFMKIAILGYLLGGPPGNPRGTPGEPPGNPRGTPGEPPGSSRSLRITQNYENEHKLPQMCKMISKNSKCAKNKKKLQMHSEVTKCTRRLHNYLKQAKTHKPINMYRNCNKMAQGLFLVTPQGTPSFSTYIVKDFLHLFLLAMAVDTNNSITPKLLFRTQVLSNFHKKCDSYVMLKDVNCVRAFGTFWPRGCDMEHMAHVSRNVFDINGFVGETKPFVVTHLAPPPQNIHMYIYIYMYSCMYIWVHICIYIYIERERETETFIPWSRHDPNY